MDGGAIDSLKTNSHMKIVNMTPHPLTLVGNNGTLNVPVSGQVARLAVTRQILAPVTVDGVELPVNCPVLGDIVGLPDPQTGVILVVSALVAEAAERLDVMSPGELLRDENGGIIGAKGLSSYA
jgi:hypothetical protein